MNIPKKGSILIAEPFLKDPNFLRSVVVICEKNEEGTLGFVLNHQFSANLDRFLPGLEGFIIPVYIGGPVMRDTLHFLHCSNHAIPGSLEVGNGIYWGGDVDYVMKLIINKMVSPADFRFFLGYSGWGVAQLEVEMQENSWILSEATTQIVFEIENDKIWSTALKSLGGKYGMMVNFPLDPSLN